MNNTHSLSHRRGTVSSSNSRPIRKTSDALSKLRTLIDEDGYHPGMKLPSERFLASEWKIGRPAVREAIKALTILDVLESRRGDGTYVKSLGGLSIGWAAKVDEFELNFDMVELLEVRKMIEPKAAALAAARATERQIQELQEQLRAQEEHPDDRQFIGKHDYLFHDAIINAAGNHILSELNRILGPLLLKSRSITANTSPDMGKMLREHRTIFEVIAQGQSDLAERAMLDHLHTVGLDLLYARRRSE